MPRGGDRGRLESNLEEKCQAERLHARRIRELHFAERHLAIIKKCKTLREDYTCPNCALCMIDALSRLGRSHHETSARLCLCVFLSVFAIAMPLSRTSQPRRRKTCCTKGRCCSQTRCRSESHFRRPKERKSD